MLKPKHGELTTLFQTKVNHKAIKPDRPARPTAEELRLMSKEDKEDLQYLKDEYLTDYREWVRERAYIKRQSALFFGDIMLTLSKVAVDKLKENRKINFEYNSDSDTDSGSDDDASMEHDEFEPEIAAPRVRTDAKATSVEPMTEWELIKLSCNPEKLLARIIHYFSKPITNNPQTDQLTILNECLHFLQTHDMTVDQYYEMFKIKVKALEATGMILQQRISKFVPQ